MNGNDIIAVKGGNYIASGIIHRLTGCGFNVLVIEGENPSEIRRRVSFCEAVFDGETKVEGVACVRVRDIDEARLVFATGKAALIVDEGEDFLKSLKPRILIDAKMSAKKTGTNLGIADYVIALGAGFFAGSDADCVIETMPGHRLGSVIYSGYALSGTGAGEDYSKPVHSPVSGEIRNICTIGDRVEKGDVIAKIGYTDVLSPAAGVLRGIIRNSYNVARGMTIAEIAWGPFQEECCFTMCDRTRCISGSVLEEVIKYIGRG